MKLKSLELFGFKSFVDKTAIHIGQGITGVVGPNGCGKTNIVDAIRWAMGEQSAKQLRGHEMQDVIFNGTAARPPMGMAQVILHFDLTDGVAPIGFSDYSEIQVERRLYRSGESEYYLNQVPSRLRDVIDLFLGTGVGTKAYSIIEQGRIERILQAKPEERRFIIEEAAGISKFKNRKETALRKMESTGANLARLKDVIAEIKRQLASLDRQAKRAERYKRLYEELKGRELKLSSFQYQRFETDLERLEANHADFARNETELAALLSSLEANIEKERLNSTEIERNLSDFQEKYYAAQNAVKLSQTTIEYQANQLKNLEVQTEKDASMVQGAQTKSKSLEKELENLNQEQVCSDLSAASVQEKILSAEAALQTGVQICADWQEKAEKKNKEILECVGQVVEAQSRLEYLEKRDVELAGRIAKSQAEMEAIDKVLKELEKKITKAQEALMHLKGLSFKLSDETLHLKEELEQVRKELNAAIDRLETFKTDLAAKVSRHSSLMEIQKNMEGFQEGARQVLKASHHLSGILGAVSDIIDTEAPYESAVAAVLGEKLQYVVVQSQKEGLEALDYLKQQSAGRSTFIPLDIQAVVEKKSASELRGDGVLGPLLAKVRFNEDCKRIAEYLFGDCVLVEDLEKALNLWGEGSNHTTFVTLQGDLLHPEGILSGGVRDDKESMLGLKRRLEEMEGGVARAKSLVEETQAKVWDLKEKAQSLEGRLESASRDFHGEEIRFVSQEKDLLRLEEEKARLEQDRDRLSLEIAEGLQEQKGLDEERETIVLNFEEKIAKQEALEKDLSEYQAGLTHAALEKDRLATELSEVKASHSQWLEQSLRIAKELEKGIGQKLELQASIEKGLMDMELAAKQKVELEGALKRERTHLEEALKELEVFKARQTTLKEQYEHLSNQTQTKERSLRGERNRTEEIRKAIHLNDLELAKTKREIEFLASQMIERYKIDISQYPLEGFDEDLNVEQETQAIAELKDKLERLGSVHVGALEEYEELKQRHEFLAKQEVDLEKSLEDLKKAIQKINRVSRERFLQTFELVNDKFQEVFPKLFKGGKAKLILVDEQNLLESGVEIVAQPPGKKLQSISLLSGGEKALTAVALIFSIFLIKPSPFCLLDEVDAPLDDANIDRFNDLVREMTDRSQFIIITHNKRTMERADSLYGITMGEPGISKVVSVRLNAGNQEPLAQVA